MVNNGAERNTQYLPAEHQTATSKILKKNVCGLKANNFGYTTIVRKKI